ncbi:hypothetical protein MTP99_019436 [Tenebrio molitor]|nr:hypothetical protein MTP99_019436 [Tenebrio molitor]
MICDKFEGGFGASGSLLMVTYRRAAQERRREAGRSGATWGGNCIGTIHWLDTEPLRHRSGLPNTSHTKRPVNRRVTTPADRRQL